MTHYNATRNPHSAALREAHYGKLQGPAKQPHPSDKRSLAWVYAVVLVGALIVSIAA